MLTIKLH